eukprot:scaffold141812_cov63-Attheya_sp.AAC.4
MVRLRPWHNPRFEYTRPLLKVTYDHLDSLGRAMSSTDGTRLTDLGYCSFYGKLRNRINTPSHSAVQIVGQRISRAPINMKMALTNAILYPVKTHIHCFRVTLADSAMDNA